MKPDTFRIMAVLADGECDAARLLERLAERGGGRPTVPTFYRRLSEALEQGWVAVVGSEKGRGPGRPGQVYRLTMAGRRVAKAEAAAWRLLSDLLLEGGS